MTLYASRHRSPATIIGALLFLFFAHAHAQTSYTIAPSNSSIRIITDKGGIAAAAAHQHVVSIKNINGSVSYSKDGTGLAQFKILPEEFLVDDEAERALYPEIFTKPVPPKAVKGTRKNMLGKKLLHAAKYPEIEVSIELASLQGEVANFATVIKIKEQTIERSIPGTLVFTDDSLRAMATFNLANKDLGLKVFSALFGAISVGHDLKFIVDINASKPGSE